MSFLDDYVKFIEKNSIEFSKNNVPVLSVPFPGFFGDAIEVFIEKKGDEVTVHDNGHTLDSILDTGFENIDQIIEPFNCSIDGLKIIIKTSQPYIGESIQNLILACLEVYAMGKK